MFVWYFFLISLLVPFMSQSKKSKRIRQFAAQELIDQAKYSVEIQYPRWMFKEGFHNWKKCSQPSFRLSNWEDYRYHSHARAQDAEDVLLIEQWFYGRTAGIILEVHCCDLSRAFILTIYTVWRAWWQDALNDIYVWTFFQLDDHTRRWFAHLSFAILWIFP